MRVNSARGFHIFEAGCSWYRSHLCMSGMGVQLSLTEKRLQASLMCSCICPVWLYFIGFGAGGKCCVSVFHS